MDTAVDGLGQAIQVGDKIVWMSVQGRWPNIKIFVVRGFTAKRVAITEVEYLSRYPDAKPTYVAYDVVIVINKLINDPCERDE